MFIVIEGIDGCGKSTQARLLFEWLMENGHDVLLTAEPTRNRIGIFIREILSGSEKADPKTLALLFTADRYEHLENEVGPALSDGKIVISERYFHSTIAYQSAQGVSREWLNDLNYFVLKPGLTILLDVKPEIAIKRIKRTETNEIFENRDFLEKVHKEYLRFDDVKRVDANPRPEIVFDEIKEIVSELI
ncbi:MAG TPA: dTMP kinase [Candidatus Altiarchaeales archaeon]|nr:dTMP kinase [Candidatus Altiarchaeales archaeon]